MKNTWLYILFPLMALGLFLLVTKNYHLGITTDSVSYLEGAKNISKGNGYVDNNEELINHWPPFYSVSLAIVTTVFSIDVQSAALVLNALCIVSIVVVFLSLGERLNLHVTVRGILCCLLLFARPNEVFLFAWSEGLFILQLLIIVFLLLRYRKTKALKHLLFAGFLAGLSILTRYAAAGFIAGFCVWLFYNEVGWRLKLKTVLAFMLPILLCFTSWFLYSASFHQQSIDRPLSMHLVDVKTLNTGFKTFYYWFYPQKWGWLLFVFTAISSIALVRVNRNRSRRNIEVKKALELLFILIACYVLFLLVSISFLDAYTPLDNRMLSPLYPLVLLALGTFFSFQKRSASVFSYALAMVLLVGVMFSSFPLWKQHFLAGNGYNGKAYQNLEIITKSNASTSKVTYTNAPDFLLLRGFKQPKYLPRLDKANSKEKNEAYDAEVKTMETEINNGSAQLLYIHQVNWRTYLMSADTLRMLFSTQPTVNYPSGFFTD